MSDASGAILPVGAQARSERTRLQILVTAERLFAEHGLDNVSMRQIALAARQRNHFAVQYHFGTKDALVDEILTLRRAAVNQARRPLLAAARAGDDRDRAARVRAIVAALVRPLADQLENDETDYFLRFQDQAMGRTPGADGSRRYPIQDVTSSSETGVDAVNGLAAELPDLADETLALRIGFSLDLMLRALAERERAEHREPPPTTDRGRFVDELIASITAILLQDLPVTVARRPGRRSKARPGRPA